MRTFRGFVLLIVFSATTVLHADATVRFKMEMKLAAGLPPAAAQQIASSQKSQFPTESVIEIKGDKGYSNAGRTVSLLDFTKQQITLLDSADKLFATVYVKDFAGEMGAALPPMPPAAQKFMESMKPDFSVRKTGRTDVILGIETEETELTVSLQMAIPADLPAALGSLKPGDTITLMKMVMHIWTPLPAEVARVPALTEFAAHSWKALSQDPTTAMRQMLPNSPGFSDSLAKMTQEISKNAVPSLKTHTEVYVPVLAQLGALLQGKAPQVLGSYDPNTPLAESDSDVVEISSAPVDDSLFQIPGDYHATSVSDLLKAVRPNANTPQLPTTMIPGTP
jgi:hypothetical protein